LENNLRVGVHTSIAGGVENAVDHARRIGCDTFQMFSANPRGWKAADPEPEACERFRRARAAYGQNPVAVHANYLLNLASAQPVIRRMSIAAFRRELGRALALGADYVVIHPGSAKGGDAASARAALVDSLAEAARDLPLNGLQILVENTAGQGSALGRKLEEVAEILAAAKGLPVGACVDTAHLFAAGYPIHTPEGLEETLRALDQTVGLQNVRLIHANDSKSAFGSRVDRHEHIGKGWIGKEAFGRLVRHPQLASLPFICETPVDRPGDDRRNLRMMRALAAGGPAGFRALPHRRSKIGSRCSA
jgi:deoxyribonuclease-4